MKLKQIKTAYKNLELIIYKKKYLIPAKPQKPLTPHIKFTSSQKQLISEHVKKHKEELLKIQKASKSKKQTNIEEDQQKLDGRAIYQHVIKQLITAQHPTYLKIKEQFSVEAEAFKLRNKQHNQKYMKPSVMGISRPYAYFFKKYYHQFYAEDPNIKQIMGRMQNRWKEIKDAMEMVKNKEQQGGNIITQIDQEQIAKQQELAKLGSNILKQHQKYRQKQLQIYRNYIQNHQIPKPHKLNSFNQYISEYKNQISLDKITSQLSQNYHKLTVEQKQTFSQRAKQKNKMSEIKYREFLKKWEIDHQKLSQIRNICQQYENVSSKQLRKGTKKIIQYSNMEIDLDTQNFLQE